MTSRDWNRSPKKPEKERLLEEAGRCCIYCGVPLSLRSMTVDHIIPRAKGGANMYSNKACSCQRCNNEKGNLTLRQYMETRNPGAVSKFIDRIEKACNEGRIDEEKYLRLAGKKEQGDHRPPVHRSFTWRIRRFLSVSVSITLWPNTGYVIKKTRQDVSVS